MDRMKESPVTLKQVSCHLFSWHTMIRPSVVITVCVHLCMCVQTPNNNLSVRYFKTLPHHLLMMTEILGISNVVIQ